MVGDTLFFVLLHDENEDFGIFQILCIKYLNKLNEWVST